MEAHFTLSHHEQWYALLQQVAEEGKDVSGRSYLYIKTDEVLFFKSPEKAKNEGYKPLSLKKIFKITRQQMKNCGNPDFLMKIAGTLQKISQIEFYKQEAENLNKKGFFKGLLSLGETKRVDSIKKYASDLYLNNLLSILDQVTDVFPSSEGNPGVIFLETRGVKRLVLKPVEDPIVEAMATHFLDFMGFKTPISEMIDKSSKEGKKICTVLEEKNLRGGPLIDGKLSREMSLQRAIDRCNFILVMECLNATSFKQLEVNRILEAIEKESLLQEIGGMIFFDHFLGNDDRLGFTGVNAGNFMLDSEDDHLVLIDNEIQGGEKTDEKRDIIILRDLEKLFTPELSLVVTKFLDALGELTHEKFDEEFARHVEEHFKIGIRRAAEKLIENFSDEDLLKRFVSYPGFPFSPVKKAQVLSLRLKLVRDLIKEK